jgi:4-amino-4-deoxy-L-arabinose transferase-like glycosyltransferase
MPATVGELILARAALGAIIRRIRPNSRFGDVCELMLNRFRRAPIEVALTVAVFVLALFPRWPGLALFWTGDEPFYYDCVLQFGRALKAANWAETLGPPAAAGVPSVTTRWQGLIGLALGDAYRAAVHVLGLPWPTTVSSHAPGLDTLAQARLPGVLLAAGVVTVAYVVLRHISGRRVALLAALLLAFDPLYLALSRVMGNDALHAGFALWAVLAVWLTFLRGDRRWMWVFGACAGLAILSKSPALVLLPLLPVLAVLLNFVLLPRARGIVWSLGAIAIAYAATVIVTVALWPALWVQPVETLRGIFAFSGRLGSADNFFLGVVTLDPGPLYYPAAIALRLNPLVVVGLPAALAAAAAWLWRGARRPASAGVAWTVLFLALASAYVALLTFAPKKSDHYALPIILACDVTGAVGLVWLGDRLAGALRRSARTAALVIGVLVAAYGVYTCAWSYPYYFPAYNPLLGGLPTAVNVKLVGWGEGLERAAAYLNSRPNAASLQVGGNILINLPGYFVGPKPASRPRPLEQLDYYVDYITWRQRNMVPLGFDELAASTPPEYALDIGGVRYVAVYRIPPERYRVLPTGATEVEARYADGLRLAGYRSLPLRRSATGRIRVPVSLYWQADAFCDRNRKLTVSLVNGAGTAWGERAVEPPCGDPLGWRADAIVRADVNVDAEPATPPGEYALRGVMIDTRNGYEVPPGSRAGLAPESVGLGRVTLPRQAPVAPDALGMEHALGARFGDDLNLLGYDVAGSSAAGETLTFTAYWQAQHPVDRRYRVFIHLLDRNGQVVAAQEAEPADGFYPTNAWAAGDLVRDPHRLALTDDRAAGAVGLEIGLVDPTSGERLPVTLADGGQPDTRAVQIGGR